MPSERPAERFAEIAENCARILRYVEGLRFGDFETDTLRRDAVERCIERISEAARKLGSQAEEEVPGQPWPEIRAVGNVIRHQYDEVDPAVIWRIATIDIPALSRAIAGRSA